jgi:lipopolysaccharide transport system ATP-binding protein
MTSVISIKKVSKRYRTGKGLTSLRELFSNVTQSSKKEYHWAVRDVSFDLQEGDALGIIGPNGAGKTTILKLLSRVVKPTSGELTLNGRLSALIELGAGFHPDLTGRENIYLNGVILGMSRSEIDRRFDQIVEFAGIGEYLDTPVKRYSSGMFARLGFSIAAHVDPQVLLVDEVLAVGDYAFRMKCYSRMRELREQGTTMIFVSHNMEAVRRVCDRGLVMYRGEAIYQGGAAEAVVAYSDELRAAARRSLEQPLPSENGLSERVMTFDAEIENVRLVNKDGIDATVFQTGDVARLEVDAYFNRPVREPVFALAIRAPDGQLVYDTTTSWNAVETPDFEPGDRCRFVCELNLPLLDGTYEVGVNIVAADLSHFYDYQERSLTFSIIDFGVSKGLVDLDAKLSVRKLSMSTDLI